MRKLLNDPFAVVDEMIDGLLVAGAGRISRTAGGRGLYRSVPGSRRTAVVTGGGSGHEPAFAGYLGDGLADGVAVGGVFAAPAAAAVVEVVRAVKPDGGALLTFGNYEGDVMNFGLAAELLEAEGVPTDTVLVTDDVVSALVPQQRRGVAGDVVVLKAAGARADEGAVLAEVTAAARHANARTRSAGVALAPCQLPTARRPTFALADGEMAVGMGVHGEAGLRQTALASADDVAGELLDLILADLPAPGTAGVHVMINTLGSTTAMEAYVVLRHVAGRLAEDGVLLRNAVVGEFLTSLEMAGLSITVVALDDELDRLLGRPSFAIAAPSLGGWR